MVVSVAVTAQNCCGDLLSRARVTAGMREQPVASGAHLRAVRHSCLPSTELSSHVGREEGGGDCAESYSHALLLRAEPGWKRHVH